MQVLFLKKGSGKNQTTDHLIIEAMITSQGPTLKS